MFLHYFLHFMRSSFYPQVFCILGWTISHIFTQGCGAAPGFHPIFRLEPVKFKWSQLLDTGVYILHKINIFFTSKCIDISNVFSV